MYVTFVYERFRQDWSSGRFVRLDVLSLIEIALLSGDYCPTLATTQNLDTDHDGVGDPWYVACNPCICCDCFPSQKSLEHHIPALK